MNSATLDILMDSPKNRLAPPAKDRERRLAHSNSTSRLFVHKKKTIIEEPREEVPKRFASTEGRFSIIDEHSKDSGSDSDQDGPLPSNEQFSKQKVLRPNFSKSVDYSHSQGMTSSASRFRIVPVESRYKRGRWNCFDYYEKETIVSKTPKMSCPGPFKPVMPKNDRSVRSLNSEFIPPSAPSTQVAFNFDISSDSDRENAEPLFNKSSRSFSKEVQVMPCKTAVQSAPNNKNLGVECCANGRMTPTEMLQSGLEKSLNTSEIKMEVDVNYQKNEIKRDNSNCTSSNNNGNSPAMVAIDSKIEQAMDLVKTHLMFAVREEVEVLRAKIVELESHIHHLEAENSILKEHIPDDILKNLSISSKNA